MRRADWIVDVGPDAGENGGRVLYSGPPDGLGERAASHTARYPVRRPPKPRTRAARAAGLARAARHHPQQPDRPGRALSARRPTSVVGVSGSGKSSLVSQALVELVCRHLGHEPAADDDEPASDEPTVAEETRGHLGAAWNASSASSASTRSRSAGRRARTSRPTRACSTTSQDLRGDASGALAPLRRGRFSFNVAKGRCETCEGEGFVSVELLFMPSVYCALPDLPRRALQREDARGHLARQEHRRRAAHDGRRRLRFFADEPSVLKPWRCCATSPRLPAPRPAATELSGGEAQRIKLATELQKQQRGRSLYVLDEPTTGLHPADVDKLLTQLEGLVDAGNTVIVVEHEERVIAASDWVIEVGPARATRAAGSSAPAASEAARAGRGRARADRRARATCRKSR
jgi:excinuclease ABC subunit A